MSGLLQSRRSFFTIIHQGTEGWRTFLGRNATRLDPGLRLKLPFFHEVRVVDLREAMITVSDLHAYTKDNVPVSLSGSLFYQVHDSHKSVFGVRHMEAAIASLGTSAARSVIGQYDYDAINADRRILNKALCETIDKGTERWGANCTKFEIQSVNPSNIQAEKELERQMTAERKRRENHLNTEALIRSAEGDKQSAILKSEGAFQAACNEANGQKFRIVTAAEAAKVQLDLETAAVIKRLESTVQALGGNHDLAVQYWIEQRRIDSMSQIAQGPNNNTYVLPTSLFEAAKSFVPAAATTVPAASACLAAAAASPKTKEE